MSREVGLFPENVRDQYMLRKRFSGDCHVDITGLIGSLMGRNALYEALF